MTRDHFLAHTGAFVATFFMLLVVAVACGCSNSPASQFADVTTSPHSAFTEDTILIEPGDDPDEMSWRVVAVPTMGDASAYLCIAIPHKRVIECLYIKKDGVAVQRQVKLDEEKT